MIRKGGRSISFQRSVSLFNLRARPRKSWLLAAFALASLSLCLSEPVLAQACGALDAAGSAICTPGGNNYTSGINYPTNNTPISVTVQPTVQVIPNAASNLNAMPTGSLNRIGIPAGSFISDAVNLANTTGAIGTPGADLTLSVNSAIIDNTAVSADNKSGLRLQASGNGTIRAMDTQVSVTGTQSTNAIWAIVLPSSNPNTAATVNYIGPVSGPGVT